MSPAKPSRSDEVIPANEQAEIQAKVSQYFDAIAPKRAEKPSRSDPAEGATAALSAPEVPHELALLQKLNADHTPILPQAAPLPDVLPDEDAVLTDYYTFVPYDHEHRPTGQGFIKLDASAKNDVHLSDSVYVAHMPAGIANHLVTNPGCSDWTPDSATTA